MSEKNTRGQFATRLGVVAVTVGSAVGLGNIWRFPYEAGTHGGGAFMLTYLLFVFIIGVPVILAEFVIGRHTGTNVRSAFRRLAPRSLWSAVGYMGILASVLILGFYSVVAGWTMEYIWQSVTGFGDLHSPDALHNRFDAFAASGWRPVMWTLLFLACNYLILSRGVEKGIEKVSNVLMPLLFVILVAFCIHSLFMPGAGEGLRFLFSPDFSQLTPSTVLGAMGQAFFSLSLGLGCLITYSSYFSRRTPLVKTAVTTALLDTPVAVLAGVIIFPAVFAYGQQPAAGPKLVFEVLPAIFADMPYGMVWSTLFFVLLFLASLTSTISMSEISIAWLCDDCHMGRRKATALNIGVASVLGTLCALSFGCLNGWRIFGKTVFDAFDYFSSNILLLVGGLLISVFTGWVLKRAVLENELCGGRRMSFAIRVLVFCMRYVAPAGILIVFFGGL